MGKGHRDHVARGRLVQPGQQRPGQNAIVGATAADQIFSMLMGDQVSPRRDFIETYAKEADNLDV